MSNTPRPIDVDAEINNMAEIEQAIVHNTMQIDEVARVEAAAAEEGQKIEAQGEAEAKAADSQLKDRPTADTAIAIAEEGVGLTAVKVGKTMLDMAADTDPGKNREGVQTMEQHIRSGAVGEGTTKASVAQERTEGPRVSRDITGQKVRVPSENDAFRCIQTKHQFGIASRADNASGSINGDTPIRGARQNTEAVATLQKQCQEASMSRMLSKEAAGVALQARADKGAQMAKAPVLAHNGMGNGPPAPNMRKAVEDDRETWAGT